MTPEEKKARRVRQAAERRAWRQAKIAAWQALVEQHFSYLQDDFGFHISDVDYDAWYTRVVYRSSTTVVYVDRSIEFARVEVALVRLVDDTIPPIAIFFSQQAPFYQTLFDNVLQIRDPARHDERLALRGLADEQIESALIFWAAALRTYAADILRGDFTVFEEVKALIAERVRQRPQVITVYTPTDAPPEQEQALAKEVDPGLLEVTVEVRRYKRPAPKKRVKPTPPSNDTPQ